MYYCSESNSAEENLGCEMPDLIKGTTVTMEGFADARIDLKRGTVIVEAEKCKEYMDWKLWGEEVKGTFGPESYYASDFSFFYYNIRENAKLLIKNGMKRMADDNNLVDYRRYDIF